MSGNYMSFRLSKVLEQICEELHNGNSENEQLLLALLKELIALQKMLKVQSMTLLRQGSSALPKHLPCSLPLM